MTFLFYGLDYIKHNFQAPDLPCAAVGHVFRSQGRVSDVIPKLPCAADRVGSLFRSDAKELISKHNFSQLKRFENLTGEPERGVEITIGPSIIGQPLCISQTSNKTSLRSVFTQTIMIREYKTYLLASFSS